MHEAAAAEMAERYHFVAGPELQPRWEIPDTIAIHTAMSGRGAPGSPNVGANSLEEYVDEASAVIDNGACERLRVAGRAGGDLGDAGGRRRDALLERSCARSTRAARSSSAPPAARRST